MLLEVEGIAGQAVTLSQPVGGGDAALWDCALETEVSRLGHLCGGLAALLVCLA
jgi:hypothetical protein